MWKDAVQVASLLGMHTRLMPKTDLKQVPTTQFLLREKGKDSRKGGRNEGQKLSRFGRSWSPAQMKIVKVDFVSLVLGVSVEQTQPLARSNCTNLRVGFDSKSNKQLFFLILLEKRVKGASTQHSTTKYILINGSMHGSTRIRCKLN